MDTVYKYRVPFDDNVDIETYECAEVLAFDVQEGQLTIWARVDTTLPPVVRRLRLAGTGHPLDNAREYIGTCQDGVYVWHLFERDY